MGNILLLLLILSVIYTNYTYVLFKYRSLLVEYFHSVY